MSHPSRILELSAQIQHHTQWINDHLVGQGQPLPSWDLDTPQRILEDPEGREHQACLLEATDELQKLVLGPIWALVNRATDAHQALVDLQAICRHNIAQAFDPGSTITFAELAQKSNMPESDMRRILRYAMTNRVFTEPTNGQVAHTPSSKALGESRYLQACISHLCEEMWPAATQVANAMERWPGSEEPTECGWSVAHHSSEPVFVAVSNDPVRARRFADSIAFFSMKPGFEHEHVVNGYPWAGQQGQEQQQHERLVVDIGGSHGAVPLALARAFPNVRCVVQDLPKVVASARVPAELRGRLSFQAHDFFAEQPVRGADVYLFRWVLHNWVDGYALRILRALVPALRRGAEVLVNEVCLPEPGTRSPWRQKNAYQLDMGMKQLLNARERDADDWKALFAAADARFEFVRIVEPPGSELALVVFRWVGPTQYDEKEEEEEEEGGQVSANGEA